MENIDMFKVWDNEKKEWLHAGVGQDIFCNNDGKLFFKHYEEIKALDLKRYVKVNCIGSEDKNGNLIWQCDIVKFPSKLNHFYEIDCCNNNQKIKDEIISKVYFTDGFFTFDWQFGYEGIEVRFSQVEVIGNKFENENLLEN